MSDEPEETPQGFPQRVIKNLFDVSPAALVASAIQFSVVLAVAWGLNEACSWHFSSGFCETGAVGIAPGILPTLTFWVITIALSIATLFLVPILWFSIPFSACIGLLYIAKLAPVWIGYPLIPIALAVPTVCWILMTRKFIKGSIANGPRTDIRSV